MDVSVPPELTAFVNDQLASGRYASASEIVGDGLRLLREVEAAASEKHDILRRAVTLGLEDAAEGRFADRSAAEIAEDVIRARGGAP